MNKLVINLFILCILFNFINSAIIKTIYVKSYTCAGGCDGTVGKEFDNIHDAIELAKLSTEKHTYIKVDPGNYVGKGNKGLVISQLRNTYLTIQGTADRSVTKFDCESVGQWLRIEQSLPITIRGIAIMNCYSHQGGGIYAYQTDLMIAQVVFTSNKAIQGAGLYIDSSSSTTLKDVYFSDNNAKDSGSGLFIKKSQVELYETGYFNNNYDTLSSSQNIFHCVESNIVSLGGSINGQPAYLYCGSSCTVRVDETIACNNPSYNTTVGNSNSDSLYSRWDKVQLYAESVCLDEIKQTCQSCYNTYDTCLTCETCSCHSTGFFFETKRAEGCTTSRTITEFSQTPVDILSNNPTSTVYASLKGYIQVKRAKVYQFTIDSTYISMNLRLDGRVLYGGEYIAKNTPSSFNVSAYLVPNTIYVMTSDIRSPPISVHQKRTLKIKNHDEDNLNIYYSNNNCGDKLNIPYLDAKPCNAPVIPISNGQTQCGDGICNEIDPNSCIYDCFDYITRECESRKVPLNHIAPGFVIDDDTLGSLIDNQMIWHLPGSEHFTMGIDIVSGKSAAAPLFYFGYCQDNTENLIQDVLRTSTFELPDELTGKMLPQCSFSTQTKTYTSTEEIRKEKAEASSMAASASISAEGWSISGSASAAYSKDTSIEQAESISTESTKTYFQSEVSCSISSVEMVKHTFHPIFLKEISQVTTKEEMFDLVIKYGTHYIKSAALGGKLVMITSTDEEMSSEEHQSEWTESVQRSASVSFKSPVLSGGASYSDTSDSTQNLEQQEDKESKSSRTSVIAIGGAPGSYSPDSQSEGKMFQHWAESIDLHPVPLNQDLFPISTIIPEGWLVKNTQTKIRDLWLSAEQLYYDLNQYSNILPFKYAIFLHFKSVPNLSTLPIIHCTWTSPTDNTKRVNVFKISHKQVLGEKKESIDFIPDFTSPNGVKERTMKFSANYEPVFGRGRPGSGQDDIMMFVPPFEYTITQVYSPQAVSPLRYDIQLAEDFFNSTTMPEFQIENMESFVEAAVHIINLRTSKAIILTKSGAITKDNYVYVSASMQFMGYGGELPEILENRLRFSMDDSIEMDTLLGTDLNTAFDQHQIYYNYEGDTSNPVLLSSKPLSPYHLKKIYDQTFIYDSFYIPSEFGRKINFYYKMDDQVGSLKRINYFYAAIPMFEVSTPPINGGSSDDGGGIIINGNSDDGGIVGGNGIIDGNDDLQDFDTKWWIRDVQAYVSPKSEGRYSSYKGFQLLNLQPLKQENSEYYLHTKNTLRYEVLFPSDPYYQPVGKYPLPKPDNYGKLCGGYIAEVGSFFDLTSLDYIDFNTSYTNPTTKMDFTYYKNLCGRSQSCVNSHVNTGGDTHIQSCSIPRAGDLIVHSHTYGETVLLVNTDYGISLQHTSTPRNSGNACTSIIDKVELHCDPAQEEPIITSLQTAVACTMTSQIISKQSCANNIYYDKVRNYYYDLSGITLIDGNYYDFTIAQVPTKTVLYFNVGGYVDSCTDRDTGILPYDIYQSCLYTGDTFIKLGKLNKVKVTFEDNGDGINLAYENAQNLVIISMKCDSTTSFTIVSVVQLFTNQQYKVNVKSNYACGIKFNSQSIYGIPDYYRSMFLYGYY